MARSLPPLNPLRVFEAVARLGNLTKAADEMHVSQSAVSRQVAVIEDYLDVKLFRRDQRGVTLTEAGHSYYQQIGPAFAKIVAATEDLLMTDRRGPIKVRAYTTFAAKWLLRRLPNFRTSHPEIEVRLSTNVTPVDFLKENIDLAIQFGDGVWPNLVSEHLFDDEITPVCSPVLLQGDRPLTAIEDLAQFPLLISHYRKTDWADWLLAVGQGDVATRSETMEFSSSILTYQAAVDGLGIAMGQPRLLDQELENGTLVCPFKPVVRRKSGYYLLLPPRDSVPRKVGIFRDWLLGEVRAMPDSATPMPTLG